MAKILIVDETGFTRRITRKALCHEHEITEASNGLQALDILVGEEFDCIVTDTRMPVMSGFELLQRLDEQGSEVAVVVLTEDLKSSTKRFCEHHGAAAICHKPIDADELRSVVGQAVESRTSRVNWFETDAPHSHAPTCLVAS